MGCGLSKPSPTSEETATNVPEAKAKPPLPPQQKASQQASKGSMLPEVQKESGSTADSAAEIPAANREQSPTNKNPKRSSARALEAKRRNDSGRQLQSEGVELQGPPRDYKGLPVEKQDDDRFSHITRLASSIMKASCALVILGQEDRIVLANAEGLDSDDDFWLPGFCAWALSQDNGLCTIEDLTQDPRTANQKWVEQDPNIGFYSGAALHDSKGERLGVLCVLDFEAKPGSAMMCHSLPNLGEMVHREIQAANQANSAENLLYRAMDTYWDGSVLISTLEGPWTIRYANEAFSNMTGIDRHVIVGKNLRNFLEITGSLTTEGMWRRIDERTKQHVEFDIFPVAAVLPSPEFRSSTADFRRPQSRPSNPKKLKITMRPQSEEILRNYGMVPSDKEINGVFFAVFSPLTSTTSRGTTSAIMDIVEKLVPFEGVEMGPIIGKGSFGSVFKAVYFSKIVAIKVIEFGDIAKVDAKGDPLEASLMLGLKHANIVETIEHKTQQVQKEDTVEHQHCLQRHGSVDQGSASSITGPRNLVQESWLMLEYCDIGTLSDGLEMGLFHEELQNGALQNERVPKMMVILQTARDIAAGLDHVHNHHILHGDLTAGNVLLASTPAGVQGARAFTAKVADFGLSRQAIASKVETNTYGTVTHMPPELLNEGIVSKAADVYAYGVLLCEVFTRRPVWEGLRHPQIIHAIAVQKKHPELPVFAPGPYKELANSCMAAEPDERPSFGAIIDSIDVMLSKKI